MYFIAAMMILIIIICTVAVVFFFKTYKKEMRERDARIQAKMAAAEEKKNAAS